MKSKHNNFSYNHFDLHDIQKRTAHREGELRIGESIVKECDKKYIILGIEESVGPQANLGNNGAENAFEPFLNKFLNMQANRFLSCDDVDVIGKISTISSAKDVEEGREMVEELDTFVFDVLSRYCKPDQIPIVIGGGHNNCYPILKFTSQKRNKGINVVNLDPHADYRILEGRHSGNGFSYAHKMSYLKKYFAIGLHQSYNSEEMLARLDKHQHVYSLFEDYLSGESHFQKDFDTFKKEIEKQFYGVELDLDSIVDMPSSALTPSGITLERARIYVSYFGASNNVIYLHLPEGAPKTDVEKNKVGKALAYLVSDFLKANKSVVA